MTAARPVTRLEVINVLRRMLVATQPRKPDTEHGARKDTGKPAEPEKSKPSQPSADEQSGSTGRRAADRDTPQGKDTGQDRYGQSGFAGTDPGKKPGK
jgi:hypothetical protein